MSIEYLVGVLTKPTGHQHFLWQNNNLGVDADDYEAKDENGNTKLTAHLNHRLTGDLTAIIPAGVKIPVKGEIIELTGVELPTIDARGNITGDFKINPESNTPVKVVVNGASNVTQNNQGYQEVTLSVVRYLVNGIPDAGSSSSSAS
jgi:hypothetical protein